MGGPDSIRFYARHRLVSELGSEPEGTGARVVSVRQVHDQLQHARAELATRLRIDIQVLLHAKTL